MHPILFKIGPLTVYSYGAMIAAAFFICTWLAGHAAKTKGLAADFIINSSLLILFSGIFGARILYVFLSPGYYLKNPIEIIMLQHGGLAFYGGAAAAVLAEWLYIKKKNMPVYRIGDLLAPYVALGQAIGRIGCFLNGCCFGKPTDNFFGVVFPGASCAVHPTQIYSSLALLFLYIALRFLQSKNLKEGTVLISYFMFYAVIRFMLEFLRGDNMISVMGLTFSQFVGIVVFIACIILFIFRARKTNGKNPH
ncbi:MAG: prolipoprotein diacylglyceryl transferase [Candidatus Omnitrophica bacterium CG_4_9_14_0_2_um_filter_43_12]|nr:MAG: prolipoprotein diacylglyceryl transferase [Candidatus Omnitrophica bacterium CG10_big_fil_rev_8_21_14_0_10_43_8]PJC46107.1 MAG: prolipoprotein diacylglyceryl transferase [Candidatus Omnitrophica bacterium CG_4_9_14_0_2_um_filter_43_12]